jgi:hypothetical protein
VAVIGKIVHNTLVPLTLKDEEVAKSLGLTVNST